MITDTFDNQSEAIINPQIKEDVPAVDACILTFSHVIEKFVLDNYECKQIGTFWFATGATPIYQIDFRELNLYTFFTGGDLLDAPKWDERRKAGELKGTQHDAGHFDIAFRLALAVTLCYNCLRAKMLEKIILQKFQDKMGGCKAWI